MSQLQQQAQELVLGDGGFNSFLKTLVTAGTELLKFANSDIGQLIIKVGLLSGTLALLNKAMTALKVSDKIDAIGDSIEKFSVAITRFNEFTSKGSTSLRALSYAISYYTDGAISAEQASQALSFALSALPLVAIVAGVVALTVAVEKYYKSTDDLVQATDDLISKNKDLQSQYDQLKNKDNLNDSDKERLQLLQAQIKANKTLIQQEYEKASASRQYTEESGATFSNGVKHAKVDTSNYSDAIKIDTESASINQLVKAYDTLNVTKATSLDQDSKISAKKAEIISKLTDEANSILDAKDAGVELSGSDQVLLAQIQGLLDGTSNMSEQEELLAEKFSYNTTTTSENTEAVQENATVRASLGDAYDKIMDKLDDYNSLLEKQEEVEADSASTDEDISKATDKTSNSYETLASALDMSSEELEANVEASGDSIDTYVAHQAAIAQVEANLKSTNQAYQDSISSISDMSSAYGTLNSVVAEYNSTGELSTESLLKLLSLDSEYIGLLNTENGQMTLNTQAMINLANSKIDDAEATLQQKAEAEVAAIVQGNYNDTLNDGITAGNNAATGAETAGSAAIKSGQDALTGASGWATYWATVMNQAGAVPGDLTSAQRNAIANVEKENKTAIEGLEKLRGTIGKTVTGYGSLGSVC
jgi:hypothetical protein